MTDDFTTTPPRKRMAAALLLSGDCGRVLLVVGRHPNAGPLFR